MLDILSADYIRTARAKGLREQIVLFRHALRNASIPIVTILGLQFGRLLGGAIVTEAVFAWPGLGTLALSAIRNFDYPLAQACILSMAFIIVIVNLGVDVLVGWLDPRVRFD
jgi:ABC-type dipeptide/oligopeptide/nickel transport system permease component